MRKRGLRCKKLALYTLTGLISIAPLEAASSHSASPKEALMLRRITEYWKDADYVAVKRQIASFLEKNPNTELRDHLNAMLGDLYFQEKNFRQALGSYTLIGDNQIREKTFFNHLQAEFEVRDYLAVIRKAESFLADNPKTSERVVKVRYILAEACFRQALKTSNKEEKVHFLKMAKPHYKVLSQTKYSDRVLFPLAEIHRLLKEDDRAAKLYMKLAEKYPQHRERFLFQTGILQIQKDKGAALKTFHQVYEMGGKRCRLAAFNRLILLYQSGMHEEYLSFYNEAIGLMPDQKVPLLQFYEGRSHYELGDYMSAVFPLETYVFATTGRSKERKTALLLLVNCSRYTKNIELLERTLYSFKSTFAKDADVPKVLMIHAQMARENGDFQQAISDLKTIATEYPGYRDAEAVAYDYALLHAHIDQWGEARSYFSSFLTNYPNSERKVAAWRHLLNCCIEEIKNPGVDDTSGAKETFVTSLSDALVEDQVLSSEEKEQYSLIMIKCLCELDRHAEALPRLDKLIAQSANAKLLGEAHLIAAIANQKVKGDINLFVEHGEKALLCDPKLAEADVLHLELFNAYLSKSNATEDAGNRDYFMSRSADHLFLSGSWKNRSIKLDNFLWLCNYYYKEGCRGKAEAFDRAQTLYTTLLGASEESFGLNITPDSLYLENEVLKFAHLLEVGGKKEDRISILEKLVNKQESTAHLPWKMVRRSYLELARAYENGGNESQALEIYKRILQSSGHVTSIVNSSAQLNKTALEFRLLKPEQKRSDSPEMIAILHSLKDLQIQKRIAAEPIHLEAALRYAEIRADLVGKEKDSLFFYKRMADDFLAKDDPIAEEYHNVRGQNEEKNAIFVAYMTYLDAKIFQCRASIARAEGKADKATQYAEEALKILSRLEQEQSSLEPLLKERISKMRGQLTNV